MLAATLCNIPYSISFHDPHVFFNGALARIRKKYRMRNLYDASAISAVAKSSYSLKVPLVRAENCPLWAGARGLPIRLPREKVERVCHQCGSSFGQMYERPKLFPDKSVTRIVNFEFRSYRSVRTERDRL